MTTRKSVRKDSWGLPPSGLNITIKKDTINDEKSDTSDKPTRKDSLGWATDDIMGMMSHTPPTFSPGSLELPSTKRTRSGSISGRLRSASDLEDRGVIDRYQKGVLKDLIISGDSTLQEALDKFEKGDPSALEELMDSGALNRKSSLDLLDDLDFGFLNVGSLGNTPKDEEYSGPVATETLDDWDDLRFESAFADITNKSSGSGNNSVYESGIGNSLPNSLPSMGMGITPPNPFGLSEQFLDKNSPDERDSYKSLKETMNIRTSSSTSRPIGIPGRSSDMHGPKRFVGAYSPESRRKRIEKFLEKRQKRVWTKKVKYDVRKNFADSRLRVKGRFVKKEDEQLLRELLSMT